MAAFARFDLTGRSAVVTGGSTGLGYAMAAALAEAGARVLIAGRGRARLEDAARRLERETGAAEVLVHSADLYDRADVDAFARAAIGALGGVDIFVGNAGAVHAQALGEIGHAEADPLMQLNLTTNISLTQAFVPHMKARKWGRIIFSSSTASHLASPGRANIVYSASKSGLNGFARAIAGELGRDGITVNAIVLGVFWTSILRGALDEIRAADGDAAADALITGFADSTALGRLGRPAELKGLVQLLASDAGSYITGASIPIDGGTSIMMYPVPTESVDRGPED